MADLILGSITLALFLGIIVTGYIVELGFVLWGWKRKKRKKKGRRAKHAGN